MKFKHAFLLLLIIFSCFTFSAAQRAALQGEVVEVIDGSTFVLATARSNFKVRLQYIDPPEAGQPLHEVVKSHLASLVKNKVVTVQLQSLSQEVSTGKVLLDGADLSMQMLRDGAAWYSVPEAGHQLETERSKYLEMEQQAKLEKRGVWGIANSRPAWELRLEREKAEKVRREAERRATAEKAARGGMPTNPVIGMTFTEFSIVCGQEQGDYMKFVDKAGGREISVMLVTTPQRVSKMCVGFYLFDTNGKLEYMDRRTTDR